MPVWYGTHTPLRTHKKLEAVQRRSARFMMNNYHQTSSYATNSAMANFSREKGQNKSYDYVQDSKWPSSYTTNRTTHIYNNSKRPYSKIHSPVCQNATIYTLLLPGHNSDLERPITTISGKHLPENL